MLDSMLNLIKSAPDNIAELSASVLAGMPLLIVTVKQW